MTSLAASRTACCVVPYLPGEVLLLDQLLHRELLLGEAGGVHLGHRRLLHHSLNFSRETKKQPRIIRKKTSKTKHTGGGHSACRSLLQGCAGNTSSRTTTVQRPRANTTRQPGDSRESITLRRRGLIPTAQADPTAKGIRTANNTTIRVALLTHLVGEDLRQDASLILEGRHAGEHLRATFHHVCRVESVSPTAEHGVAVLRMSNTNNEFPQHRLLLL